jgi:predicted XRE-type DNA-binding protein
MGINRQRRKIMSIIEMTRRLGVDLDALEQPNRQPEIVRVKALVCFHLWKRGIKQQNIANVLNITQQNVSHHIGQHIVRLNDFDYRNLNNRLND